MFSEHISGLARERRGEPLLARHVVAAAGGDVDHRVALGCLIARQELHEHLGIGRRPAVLRIARVQVQDRRAGFGRLDRTVGDLCGVIGRYGDIVGVWIAPVTAQVMMTVRRDGATSVVLDQAANRAADVESGTRNELRPWRREEDRGVCDIFGVADSHGHLPIPQELFDRRLPVQAVVRGDQIDDASGPGRHPRPDRPRQDGVHPNGWRVLLWQGLWSDRAARP